MAAWRVAFLEIGQPTLVRSGGGGTDLPSSGTFWIDPATGEVLRAHLLCGTDAANRLTVTYRQHQAFGLRLPSEMVEKATGEEGHTWVDGTCVYSNFRRFEVRSRILVPWNGREPIMKTGHVRRTDVCVSLIVSIPCCAAMGQDRHGSADRAAIDKMRDSDLQPERVMGAIKLNPGMVVGEAGASDGDFTFKMSRRVGDRGTVYANDIDRTALSRKTIHDYARESGYAVVKVDDAFLKSHISIALQPMPGREGRSLRVAGATGVASVADCNHRGAAARVRAQDPDPR